MANSHQSKEFRTMRAVVLWLFDYKCFTVSCTEKACTVHHNDRDNTNHEIINLIPLCTRCHKHIHMTSLRYFHSYKKIVIALLRKIAYFSSLKSYN